MQPSLSIIGSGHLARTLGLLWQRQRSVVLRDVLSRSLTNAGAACDFIGAGRPLQDYRSLAQADLYLIATPDDQIAASCQQLVACGRVVSGTVVFHCSGALPASVLEPARAHGAAVGSIHPVRSFALPEAVAQSFTGTWCGVEGDLAALAILEPLFTGIGAQLIGIDPAAKTLYHAAAVLASNHVVTLLDIAVQAYREAGIPEDVAMQILEPLVRKTVDQVFAAGTTQALSGPASRGDVATLERQYRAVKAWNREMGCLYRLMSDAAARIALRRHKAD